MSAHTTYTFPKWLAKTKLFEMLAAVANQDVNSESEFGDSFEAQRQDLDGYSPLIRGDVYRGRASRFEALLNSLKLSYERRTEIDLDTGDEAEVEFVLNGESKGEWLGEVDNFELTAQQVLDLANGSHATRDFITQAEEAITKKTALQAALDDDVVPEDFSLQSLCLLMEDAGNTPEVNLMSVLLEKSVGTVNASSKPKPKP